MTGSRKDACSVCEMKGWEKIRVKIDSGDIDTVGPKDVARAFKMKATVMSKKCMGCVAANGSSIENYGEKKLIGHR